MILWKHILQQLKDQQKVYLLTVVQNHGSSPGRQGFKMMVAQNGVILGSIGGGVMEYKLVEKAKRLLQKNTIKNFVLKQIHQAKNPDSSGMICSGEQTVAFTALSGKHLASIQQILQKKHAVELQLTPNDVVFIFHATIKKPIFTYQNPDNWKYTEILNTKKTVYIVGSGHVGLATSELLKYLEYKVVVFDNRKNLNTFTQNTFADKKEIISYDNISQHIPNNQNSLVVIMTNKYTDDKLVLQKLLEQKPLQYAYIGVLGSQSKINTMFTKMIEEGIAPKLLETIFAPIGISIKSQTPKEISVSIAAQIIAEMK